MKTITINMPDDIIQSYCDIESLKRIILEDFVAGEYEKGKITIRQGANLLKMTYEEFMIDFLGSRKISIISGSRQELNAEYAQEESWLDDLLKKEIMNHE